VKPMSKDNMKSLMQETSDSQLKEQWDELSAENEAVLDAALRASYTPAPESLKRKIFALAMKHCKDNS